jgi:hypothetical protein
VPVLIAVEMMDMGAEESWTHNVVGGNSGKLFHAQPAVEMDYPSRPVGQMKRKSRGCGQNHHPHRHSIRVFRVRAVDLAR